MVPAVFEDKLNEIIARGFTKYTFDLAEEIFQVEADLLKMSSQLAGKPVSSLDDVHLFLDNNGINSYRLESIKCLNKGGIKERLLQKITPFFSAILGQDLAYQKNLNLVLVPPMDSTSILPLHTDTWTGHSKFELALLLPLTPIVPEQNMFISSINTWKKHQDAFYKSTNLQEFMAVAEQDFELLNLNPGEALIFWHNLPHGNKLNRSAKTHWSINLRVKNIFTPYMEKGLGDYFQPYQLSKFNDFVLKEATNEKSSRRIHNK